MPYNVEINAQGPVWLSVPEGIFVMFTFRESTLMDS